MTQRRSDVVALAIVTVLTTLLFVDVLIGTHNFYMRDLARYYYPAKQILRDIVASGEFPWWNRLFGAGQPIAANPEHAVFYPLTWLVLLPSFDFGYRIQILIHVYIGLFCMYALLRSMGLREVASGFGAVSFALGGTYLSYIGLLPILYCAAWMPLTCLFVRRFLLVPSVRDFALASLLFGLQVLVGEPTTLLQTGVLLGVYALYRGWYAAVGGRQDWKAAVAAMVTRVAFVGLICGAAIAVGAAQLIPALEHVQDSARARPFPFPVVSSWSMPWAKLLEVVFPNVLGHISVDRVMWYWGGVLYPGLGSPFLYSVYPGLLFAALTGAAVFLRPRGGRLVLLVCAVSIVVALGSHTPLLRLLYDAGVATSIRFPEKFILMAVFACTLLAARLLQDLIDGDERVRAVALRFAAVVGVVAVLMLGASFTSSYAAVFTRAWGFSDTHAATMIELSKWDWATAAIRSGVLFAILWAWKSRPRRPVLVALALFVVADLGPVVHELNPRMPARFYLDEPALLRQIDGDRGTFRIFHEADWYGTEEPAKTYLSTGNGVYWILRNGLFPATPARYGVAMAIDRDLDRTALLPTVDFVQSVWDVKRAGRIDWWQPFAAMSNVRYVARYRPPQEVSGRVDKAEAIALADIGDHPRYYFADQLVTITGRGDFVQRLSGNSPWSRRVAFVPIPSFTPAPGTVRLVSETPNTVAIEVECEGRGFLVMSVTPHKYWRIEIDGSPATAVVTNIGFQGIEVPAGRHRIRMEYRNTLALGSLKVTLASSLALVLAAIAGRRLENRLSSLRGSARGQS